MICLIASGTIGRGQKYANDTWVYVKMQIMSAFVSLTVFFLDATKVTFRYPRQSGVDAATVAANVKRAIDADKLVLEVDGDLLVIPIKSVKYIQVSPAPPHLPAGVLRQARLG